MGDRKIIISQPDIDMVKGHGIAGIINLIKMLRGEGGCPWDREQTPASMVLHLIEETYELADAIKSGNPDEVCEELGDVLFLILFIISMYEEKGKFSIDHVTELNNEKMTRRHPHVFKDAKADTPEDVKKRWNRIKMEEKNHAGLESILDSVPSGLPALMRAYRISDRAARTGFDWDNVSDVIKKVEEEWNEFLSAIKRKNQQDISLEFGDILFTLVNVARFARIHPETSLADSVKKFEMRFKHMEKAAAKQGEGIESVSREEFDLLWENAKKELI